MGLVYKIVQRERKELSEMICDRCDKRLVAESEGHWNEYGLPFSCYHEPHFKEEFFIAKKAWGYFSRKDETISEIVLCEACYDKTFKKVKIKITEYQI